MKRTSRSALWAALIFGLFAAGAHAQGVSAATPRTVSGRVFDALRRPISGAQVEIQDSAGKIVAHTKSGDDGAFSLIAPARGVFAIVVRRSGFEVGTRIVSVGTTPSKSVVITLSSTSALSLKVATTKINPQPNAIAQTGNSRYTLSQHDISALPEGENTSINQVLLQMPGVVQDDQQQIHVGGEHGDLQWRINGVMMPMDSFSGFGQIFNSFFVKQLSLIDGVLPVSYGYRDAGVLDMVTKDGCSDAGGRVGFYGGQRETYQPSFEDGGCDGAFSYYYTGTYLHDNLAFSSATPGPTPYHNITNQGQGFGYFTYEVNPLTKLSLTTGVSVNDSQIPNQPGLQPLFSLRGTNPTNFPSVAIDESLDQGYYFGVLALTGVIGPAINYQVAYTGAYSTIKFNPDPVADLIYQGAASTTFHSELDNTLQTGVSREFNLGELGSQNLGAGFYVGEYGVELDDTTLAFPANSSGVPTSDVPVSIVNNTNSINMLYGVYLQDIWKIDRQLTVTGGIRWDAVTGIISNNMVSPRINVLYRPTATTALHAGFARYFQTPDFETVSPRSFDKFKDTTAAVGTGGLSPLPEKDYYWNAGVLHHLGSHVTLEENGYFRLSQDLIDLGQFGNVPIFVPFNYARGRIYGSESSAVYSWRDLSVRANFTYSVAQGNDVVSGQFNFSPAELTYIRHRYIFLDHSQFYTASGGITYKWKSYLFSVDGTYGSGLRAGFSNTEELPQNYEIDLGVMKAWRVAGIGDVKTRVVLVNVTDHINELRNGTGIGVFQPGFGPRRGIYGGISIPLPAFGRSRKTT